MGAFDHFPYTNFHELNLQWILQELEYIQTTMEQFVSINSLKYADPIQWNITSQYEKNTIVIDPLTGTAYISVAAVPMGVSLTNEDYWTVVFDLGSFVVRAAKNLATTYEAETTLTATVNTPVNGWLIWGDTLYHALVNITAGDTYVIGGNIEHFTIEDVIGHLEDLSTTDKSNLVAAINELVQALIDEASRVDGITGDLDDLNTTDKTNLVNAINEVLQTISDICGDLDDLNTTDKTNLVAAINELVQALSDEASRVDEITGDLDNLTTTDKTDLVSAINEVNGNVGDLTTLTTIDKTSTVDAINELSAYLDHTINFGIVALQYVDGVSGDDDNDGLTPATAVKTLDKAFEIFNGSLKNGNVASGLTVRIVNGLQFDFNLQYLNNMHLHLYNDSGVPITIDFTKSTMQLYNSYVHFIGTASATIIVNFDNTVWGQDNSGLWFTYCTLNSTNPNQQYCHTNFVYIDGCTVNANFKYDTNFYVAGQCEFTQNLWVLDGALIVKNNTVAIFRKGILLYMSRLLMHFGELQLAPSPSRNCIEARGCVINISSNAKMTILDDDSVGTSVVYNLGGCTFVNGAELPSELADKYNYYFYATDSIIKDRNYNNTSAVATNYIGGSRNSDLNSFDARITALGG